MFLGFFLIFYYFCNQINVMKLFLSVVFGIFFSFCAKAQVEVNQMHCGFDFTSYLVLHVHESSKMENIKNLKITIVDAQNNEVLNVNNAYSWTNSNKPLQFSLNYQIDSKGNKISEPVENARWFFPYAKDHYLLSIANTFPADDFSVKVEDPSKKYKTQIVKLYAFNMYVLCAAQSEKAVQFGKKPNRPIDIVLEL